MGRVLLVWRLAARDVRHHVTQAVLLLLAVTAATTILTLGLALNGVTSHPYQQTRAATRGPDLVAYTQTAAGAMPLIHAAGVAAYSGPYPQVSAVLHAQGRTAGAEVEGRSQAPVAVDQPKVTAGTWVRPGSVVLERTFAQALGTGIGGKVTLNGQTFTVAGIAVTAAVAPYPNICFSGCDITRYLGSHGVTSKNIGLVWMTEPDATKLVSTATPLDTYILNLKLSDPAQAQAFAARYSSDSPAGPFFNTWENLTSWYGLLVKDEQTVLVPGAVLLGLLAIASVAVLVGSRLAQYTRRVGLLKAAGATPGLVAATFLAENLVLALISAAIGLAAGILVAPQLTDPGAALLGTPGAPSFTPLMIIGVVLVALAVALASTLVPAIRAARTSTVSALADAARVPRRRGTLISLSRRMPVPVQFGLRLVARRPRRALLSTTSIAVTVCGIVAVLSFHATVNGQLPGGASGGLSNPVVSRDEQMLSVITVTLVILAVINALFTAWATVLDARRSSALMRALGASSQQVSLGLAVTQVVSALPGAIIGVPAGIALFMGVSRGSSVSPSTLWLIATVLGTLIVVAGLTTIPALIAARTPASQILQSEAP